MYLSYRGASFRDDSIFKKKVHAYLDSMHSAQNKTMEAIPLMTR